MTMRRLILFRHAKAVPHDAAPDPDRDLTERGRKDARFMGGYCVDEMLLPDLVLVSPAVRTRRTWECASSVLKDVQVEFDSSIYLSDMGRLLELVRSTRDDVKCLMIVGHNPGIEDLARGLVSHGDRYAFARMERKFPTAGLAVLDFDAEHWRDVAPKSGRLDRFRVPHDEGG